MKKLSFPSMVYFAGINLKPKLMRLGFKQFEWLFRFANLPVVRWFHPWLQPEKTRMFWVPVNKSLERGPDVHLPYQLVDEFIDKASYRVIMDYCGCRKAYECRSYPTEVGCLMMGDDARLIKSAWAREATKAEAHAHLQKAVDAGLPAIIGKARIDNFIFGVPDKGRLLTVCFCCECCCITNFMAKQLPDHEFHGHMNRLEGLKVWVDEETCVGCGTCQEHCFVEAISLSGGKAHIGGGCLGCGRCARACSHDAIHLKLDNPEFLQHTIRAIEAKVNPA